MGGALFGLMQAVAYGAVGHLSGTQRTCYGEALDRGGAARPVESTKAWSGAANLSRGAFRGRFLTPTASDELVDHLRKASEGAARGGSAAEQRDASAELAAAVRIVGADRWPRFVAAAHARAMDQAASGGNLDGPPIINKIQELLLTPKPPAFVAEPPKGVILRFMERIPRLSEKEAARDLPSWARGARRMVGETTREFAKRVMDNQYGRGNWKEDDTGPTSDFSKLRKFGERAFRDPKEIPIVEPGPKPEAQVCLRFLRVVPDGDTAIRAMALQDRC